MNNFWNNFWIGFNQGLAFILDLIPHLFIAVLLFESFLFYYLDKPFESMVMTALTMIYIQVRRR